VNVVLEVLTVFEKSLLVAVMLTVPALVAAVAAGVFISLLQSLFQIQDQALPFFVKMIAVSITLYLTGRWIGIELITLTKQAWETIPMF